MLSVHVKRSEVCLLYLKLFTSGKPFAILEFDTYIPWQISYDIIEDLLMQGDHMKDALQQLQDSAYLTKVLISLPKPQNDSPMVLYE